MKIGFFRALAGACSGVDAFEKLCLQSKRRSLWHLIVMCLLVTLIMALANVPQWYRQIVVSSDLLAAECGSLYFTNDGIVPEIEPEKSRSFLISGPVSITYLADNDEVLPENFQLGCSVGLIWSGSKIGAWKLLSDNSFEYTPLGNNFPINEPIHVATSADLADALRKSEPISWEMESAKHEPYIMTVQKIRSAGMVIICFAEFLLFLGNVIQVLMYIGMFVGVFALMNLKRSRQVKVGTLFVLAVYAGFPAMLIGSMAELVNLKFLDYHTVYVFGMTIYLMFVMNSLERKRQAAGV